MPKRDASDEYMLSDYGNWNVAADYSKFKIMKPLALCDDYETIAIFGYLELIDELTNNFDVDFVRITGFKRLIKTLIMVINNSKFAIKGTEKETLKEYKEELQRYYKIIPTLIKYKRNDIKKTRELKIIPEKYDAALDRIIELKSLINEPLNRYDLIFTHKEQFDATAYKKKVVDDATKRG